MSTVCKTKLVLLLPDLIHDTQGVYPIIPVRISPILTLVQVNPLTLGERLQLDNEFYTASTFRGWRNGKHSQGSASNSNTAGQDTAQNLTKNVLKK